MEDHLLRVLKKYWGFNKFRPHQMEICSQILNGRDVCVIMATGSGKSLLYQMPAVALHEKGIKSCVVVVSPLLSLIEDQVSFLREIGIEAEMLVGSSSSRIEEKAIHGQYTVLYITPEKVINWRYGLEELNRNTKIVCLAIDESHCLSEWGHDFRPVYRKLGQLRQWLPHVPMVALTATATEPVVTDIISNLTLMNPYIKKTTFNRPNLYYMVKKRINGVKSLIDILLTQYVGCNNSRDDVSTTAFPSTLVYVNTKVEAEDVCKTIQSCNHLRGIRCEYYHAGMSASTRTFVHRAFSHDEVQIVVATIAFGMGIHKPDIRLVVNYGMPSSLEAYYQQSGRAGRDGFPAQCVLLYKDTDAAKVFSIATMSHTASGSASQDRIAQQIQVMKSYCADSVSCRRRFILTYFKDTETLQYLDSLSTTSSVTTACCDICDSVKLRNSMASRHMTSERETEPETGWMTNTSSNSYGTATHSHSYNTANERVDLSKEIKLILRAVADCGEYFGLSTPVALLMGSNSKQVQRVRGHDQSSAYGAGKAHPTEWWLELGRLLCEPSNPCGQLLEAKLTKGKATGAFGYQRILLTKAGQRVLHSPPSAQNNPLMVQLTPVLMRSLRSPPPPPPPVAIAVAAVPQSRQQLPSVQPSLPSKNDSQLPHLETTTTSPPLLPSAPVSPSLTTTQSLQLETKLRRLRSLIAQRSGAPPYTILSSEDLKVLLNELPISVLQLQGLSGWGDWKRRVYGPEFTTEIRTFLEDCQIPLPLPEVVTTGDSIDTGDNCNNNNNNNNNSNSADTTGSPYEVFVLVELAEGNELLDNNNKGNNSSSNSTHQSSMTTTSTTMEPTANKISPHRLFYIPQYNNNNDSNNNSNSCSDDNNSNHNLFVSNSEEETGQEVNDPPPFNLQRGEWNLMTTTATTTATATAVGVSDHYYFSLHPSFSSVNNSNSNKVKDNDDQYDSTESVHPHPLTSHVLLPRTPCTPPLPSSSSPHPSMNLPKEDASPHPTSNSPSMKGEHTEEEKNDASPHRMATMMTTTMPLPALKKARTIPLYGVRGRGGGGGGNQWNKKATSGIKLKSSLGGGRGGESVTTITSTTSTSTVHSLAPGSSTSSSNIPTISDISSDQLSAIVLQLLHDSNSNSSTGSSSTGSGGGLSFMEILMALIDIIKNLPQQRQSEKVTKQKVTSNRGGEEVVDSNDITTTSDDKIRYSSAIRSILKQLSEECCIYLDQEKYKCI